MKNIPTNFTQTIQYQESDFQGHLKISSLFSKFSDLATKNALDIGLWTDNMASLYGWVLVKQTLILKKPLLVGKKYTIQTRAYQAKRMQASRTYEIFDENQNDIGGSFSVWTLIDIQQRKIVRVDKIGLQLPIIETYQPSVDTYHKGKDMSLSYVMTRKVSYSDIDINQHMNNSVYLSWAFDNLNIEDFKDRYISCISVHYFKELTVQDQVDLYLGYDEDCFSIEFKKEDDIYFYMYGEFSKNENK